MKNKYEWIWIIMFLFVMGLLCVKIGKRAKVIKPSGPGTCSVACCIELEEKLLFENHELYGDIEKTRRGME